MRRRRPEVVIDTSVLISALRSRRGASYRLLSLIGSSRFRANISVALMLEYEHAAKGQLSELHVSERTLEAILDYVCEAATQRKVFSLWRPCLPDPDDDMVLEVAVAGRCDAIVTHNTKDFRGAERFGIRILTPREFLAEIGELR